VTDVGMRLNSTLGASFHFVSLGEAVAQLQDDLGEAALS